MLPVIIVIIVIVIGVAIITMSVFIGRLTKKCANPTSCPTCPPAAPCPPPEDCKPVVLTGNNGSCPCSNYCHSDWENTLSHTLGWKGAACSGAVDSNGKNVSCDATSPSSILCSCSRDDANPFPRPKKSPDCINSEYSPYSPTPAPTS
jgi:hypothetical protein